MANKAAGRIVFQGNRPLGVLCNQCDWKFSRVASQNGWGDKQAEDWLLMNLVMHYAQKHKGWVRSNLVTRENREGLPVEG